MLILTRREHESLKIGDDVTVTIMALKGNAVRVGIEAPKHVVVHREEVYQRIRAARSAPDEAAACNTAAATADASDP